MAPLKFRWEIKLENIVKTTGGCLDDLVLLVKEVVKEERMAARNWVSAEILEEKVSVNDYRKNHGMDKIK